MATTKATNLGHRSDVTLKGTTTTIETDVVVSDTTTINNAGDDVGLKINSTSTGHIMQLQDGGTDVMVVADGGNVGIGADSPSTTRRLHIKNTDDTRGLYIENTLSTSYAEVHFKASREFRIGTGNSASDVNSRDRFFIFDATASAHRFTLDSSGNVGIGTTSPVGNLHISESGASEVRLQLTNSNTGHAGSDGLALVLSADGLNRYLWNYEDQTFHIGNNNATQIQLQSYNVADGGRACRTSLGWGADQDLLSCVLQVNSHRYYTQGAVFKDRDSYTSYAGTLLQFYRQSTSVGSITTTGSATAFNTSSDYRLKYDIKDMGSGLNIINDLKPRTFKWLVNKDTKRDDGTKFNNPDTYGFIAHEVEEAIPRANDIGFVQGEKDGEGYQSVDYTKFSPIIIKAIQELSAKVTALENATN